MRLSGMLLGLSVAAIATTAAHAETVKLTSLEWPPYTGAALPSQGGVTEIVRKALSSQGHALEVEFLPWNRAVNKAEKGTDGVVGYFPEYYSDDTKNTQSDAIGFGPLGLVENIGSPILWAGINDLKALRLGVVDGYINTTEIDTAIAANQFPNLNLAPHDASNIMLVGANRLDAAVIDKFVLGYLLETDPRVIGSREKVRFNNKLLEDKGLFVTSFAGNASAAAVLADINKGLATMDVTAELRSYFKQHFPSLTN